jgi:co-chaperonin GroES (HSP10)
MLNVTPLAGYVVLEDLKETKAGGLSIVKTEDDKTGNKGRVIACGGQIKEQTASSLTIKNCPVEVDDVIVYKKYNYTEVDDYKIVGFEDIIAIIKTKK